VECSWREDQGDWIVLDPAGKVLGTASTPANFAIHEIGNDFILGVQWDAARDQSIRMYRLER
jgi:hypothetical protein